MIKQFKVAKAQQVMWHDSRDQKVCQAVITVQTGRKWSASRAAAEAEARPRHKDIVGAVNQGRLGLGVITRARWKDASAKGRHKLVQEELRMVEEDYRQATAVSMKRQGSWTRLTLPWLVCPPPPYGLEGWEHGGGSNQVPPMLYLRCLAHTN